MKITPNLNTNARYYYNAVQLGLPLDLELWIDENDMVEGAFGVIKQNMKFTTFTRRGMKNVKMEFLLVCLGYNFRKYHYYRLLNRNNNLTENFIN